jgi:hypothetical protein
MNSSFMSKNRAGEEQEHELEMAWAGVGRKLVL